MHIGIEYKAELTNQPAIGQRIIKHHWIAIVPGPAWRAERSEKAAELRCRRKRRAAFVEHAKREVGRLNDVVWAHIYVVVRRQHTRSKQRDVVAAGQSVERG